MTYIPQNVQIFTAAYAGCLAGMGVSDRIISSTNPLVYAGIASVAGAFSKAVDTAWGARATTLLDVESVPTVNGLYLVNYTLRVSVNGGPAEATWGLIEDGNSTIDRTTSSIAEVAGLAGNVYTISQSTLIELLTTHVYTIGNVSGVNGSISGVGAPSATVNMMRIA